MQLYWRELYTFERSGANFISSSLCILRGQTQTVIMTFILAHFPLQSVRGLCSI